MFQSNLEPIISNGSREKVDFDGFAILSNGGHLGFLTYPKFVILKPWSLIILQVKFDNNCLSGFRKKSCLKLFKYAIFRYSNVTLVNRK